jgi:hypothetical protein
MNEENPDDVRQRYIEKLGQEFGAYFFHLDQSIIGLVAIWDTYRFLFGTNSERVDLLNQTSGYVARTIQDSLHERVILGVCQVSDSYRSRGRENVTVQGLSAFVADSVHRSEILPMLHAVEDATSFARDLRNKLIAHSDLAATTGSYRVDYSSRERIVAAIRSIIKPPRYLHKRYFGTTQFYHAVRPLPDEAGFLRCIYLGVEEGQHSAKLGPPRTRFPAWLNEGERNEFDLEFYLPTRGAPP